MRVLVDTKGAYSDTFGKLVVHCVNDYELADHDVALMLGRNVAFEAFKLLTQTNRSQTRDGMIIDQKSAQGGVMSHHICHSVFPCLNYCDRLV